MTPAEILTQIDTVLKAAAVTDGTLSYVNQAHIYIGKRSNITSYPAIVVDIGPARKLSNTHPKERWTVRLSIMAAIKVADESKQIVGDANIKGITDFSNDLMKVLSADHTLGGKCENLDIVDCVPDDSSDWPLRAFMMNIDVTYSQDRLTRA